MFKADCVAQGEGDLAPVRVRLPVALPVGERKPLALGGRGEGEARPLGEPPPGREPEGVPDAEELREGEEDADAERGALPLARALRVAPPRGDAEGDSEGVPAAEGDTVALPVAVGVFEKLATTRMEDSGGASESEGATANVSVSPDPAGSSSAGGHAPAGALSSAVALHVTGSIKYSAASPIAVPLSARGRVPLTSRVGDVVGLAEAALAPPVPQCPLPSRSSKRMTPAP